MHYSHRLILIGLIACSSLQTLAQSRLPRRMCLAENSGGASTSCTLSSGIPAGNGVVVFITFPETGVTLSSNAIKDSKSNAYGQVLHQPYVSSSPGISGEIYLWYSRLSTALSATDTITLAPLPVAGSWNFSLYDIGAVQQNPVDGAGAQETNPNSELWWTGQTAQTTAADLCIGGMTVNPIASPQLAPAPITSYTLTNGFTPLDIVNFHSETTSYYSGGNLMTMFAEVPAGVVVESNVTTSVGEDPASSVLQCFKKAAGSTPTLAHFTGNYCTGTTGCTLNNVGAGSMLLINTHSGDIGGSNPAPPNGPASVVDSRGETAVFDQWNAAAGMGIWHISPVVHSGTHAIAVSNFGVLYQSVSILEIAGQSADTPIDALSQTFFNSTSVPLEVSLYTSSPGDLLYGWGRASTGSDEGDGFTAIRVAPTAEYAPATGAGVQKVSLLPRGPLPAAAANLQAMAIRSVGATQVSVASPRFTGNFCRTDGGMSCTLNNVVPGDMIVISFYWSTSTSDVPVPVDDQAETIVSARPNDHDGYETVATWYIAKVSHGGSHTFTVPGIAAQYMTLAAFEFRGQSSINPIDGVSSANGEGALASVNLQTHSGNDLLYAWCGSPPPGVGTGDGFAAITIAPTAEYKMAAPTAGNETATCPVNGPGFWVIQALAIGSLFPTTTTLDSSLNPSFAFAPVTFTATVTSSGATMPTGAVTFKEGGTTLGTDTLASAEASYTVSGLTAGQHSITAVYAGDANYVGSTSAALNQIVQKLTTTTTLTSSANPSLVGSSVTFTAAVSTGTSNTPTGTVAFMDGTTTLGTGTLNESGAASYTTSSLTAGQHAISAVYSGDANDVDSTSTVVSETVNSDFALSSNVGNVSIIGGQTGTVTLTIATQAGFSSQVNLSITGCPEFATCSFNPVSLTSSGSSTLTITTAGPIASVGLSPVTPRSVPLYGLWLVIPAALLAVGSLNIRERKMLLSVLLVFVLASGCLLHVACGTQSKGTNNQPIKATTTTALASSRNPSSSGSEVTLTATVTESGSGIPTGTITFTDGSATLGSGSLNGSGVATYSTSTLTPGTHSMRGVYGGDANCNGSTSAVLSQSVSGVTPAGTYTLIVTAAAGSLQHTTAITLTVQ